MDLRQSTTPFIKYSKLSNLDQTDVAPPDILKKETQISYEMECSVAKKKQNTQNAKNSDLGAFRDEGDGDYLTTNQGCGSTTTGTRSRRASADRRFWKIYISARRSSTRQLPQVSVGVKPSILDIFR
jgi:hypothetical protein